MSTKKSPKKAHELAHTKPLALIAGPTASGKSGVALLLAEAQAKLGRKTIIINADSMQVYRDIPILSAAPGASEVQDHEHRLYCEWDGSGACSAADWAARAKAEIDAAHDEGAVPVLVGGTGMYLKVLLEGIAPIPEINPEVRAVVRSMSAATAYTALMMEDPERAIALDPADSQRISRALEVKRSTGVTLGDWQLSKTGGIGEEVDLTAIVLLPDREWLYDRCDRRFEALLRDGAIAEVETLLGRDLAPGLPVMRAIGVPEIAGFLRDEISREEMIAAGAQATRNYAKRQYTWFRNQPPAEWTRISDHSESDNFDIEVIFASLLQK